MQPVFVYGTLKRGFPNHDSVLRDARYCGDYITTEAYPLVIGRQWFVPSLLPEPGSGHRVSGELFEVDEACLAALDDLEGLGNPRGYHRDMIAIASTSDGVAVTAWVYFRARQRVGEIASGPLASYRHDPRYVASEDREWPDALPPDNARNIKS